MGSTLALLFNLSLASDRLSDHLDQLPPVLTAPSPPMSDPESIPKTSYVPSLKVTSALQHDLSLRLTEEELAYLAASFTSARHHQALVRHLRNSSLPPSVKQKIHVKRVSANDIDETVKAVYIIETGNSSTLEEIALDWDIKARNDGRTGGPVDTCILNVCYKNRKGTFKTEYYNDWNGGQCWTEVSHTNFRSISMEIAGDLGLIDTFTPPAEHSATFLEMMNELKSAQGTSWMSTRWAAERGKFEKRITKESGESEMLISLLSALLVEGVLKKQLSMYGMFKMPLLAGVLAELNWDEVD